MARGKLYIVLFTTAVCGVFSVVVSLAAVTLKERQEANRKLDQQRNVLVVADLVDPVTRLTVEMADSLFRENVEAQLVRLETGEVVPDDDPLAYDQQRAKRDPALSRPAPDNRAGIPRLPLKALVYLVKKNDALDAVVLPVEGMGLWGTMYGFLALEDDLNTIRGITFYDHGETPGLGGEIESWRWRDQWEGKRIYDDASEVAFHVRKGRAPPDDPFAVDGLAGATLTANGVTYLIQFWLGEHGFRPYLRNLTSGMEGH